MRQRFWAAVDGGRPPLFCNVIEFIESKLTDYFDVSVSTKDNASSRRKVLGKVGPCPRHSNEFQSIESIKCIKSIKSDCNIWRWTPGPHPQWGLQGPGPGVPGLAGPRTGTGAMGLGQAWGPPPNIISIIISTAIRKRLEESAIDSI